MNYTFFFVSAFGFSNYTQVSLSFSCFFFFFNSELQ